MVLPNSRRPLVTTAASNDPSRRARPRSARSPHGVDAVLVSSMNPQSKRADVRFGTTPARLMPGNVPGQSIDPEIGDDASGAGDRRQPEQVRVGRRRAGAGARRFVGAGRSSGSATAGRAGSSRPDRATRTTGSPVCRPWRVPRPSSGGRVTCPPVKHTRSVETVPVSPVPPRNPLNSVIPAPENEIAGSVVQSPENVTLPRLTVPIGGSPSGTLTSSSPVTRLALSRAWRMRSFMTEPPAHVRSMVGQSRRRPERVASLPPTRRSHR